jgi:hypothetical protein
VIIPNSMLFLQFLKIISHEKINVSVNCSLYS